MASVRDISDTVYHVPCRMGGLASKLGVLMVKLFTTETCGGCKLIKDYLKHMDVEWDEIMLGHDKDDEFKQYDIRSAPTLLFIKDQQVIHRHEGYMSQGVFWDKYKETI